VLVVLVVTQHLQHLLQHIIATAAAAADYMSRSLASSDMQPAGLQRGMIRLPHACALWSMNARDTQCGGPKLW
jgi:hypothetical protein